MLGYIPGLLHAWYIIAKYPEEVSGYEPIPQSLHQEIGRRAHLHERIDEYFVRDIHGPYPALHAATPWRRWVDMT